eukprot:GHVU01169852.1.p1 GENE.GHVU01169852.1~~GHVU01169852.1.p1  ORF type:complete len:263 (+),score=38.14 GHVU01169852.1:185-973(+)
MGAVWAKFLSAIAGKRAVHHPDKKEELEFPKPYWLLKDGGVLNWAVCGGSGVGKSSLINGLRGAKHGQPGYAKVGETETTQVPSPFRWSGNDKVVLWDLPGGGTENHPSATYIKDNGLRWFNGVIIVCADRVMEFYVPIIQELEEFGVPYYIVRSKLDEAVRSQYERETKKEFCDLPKHEKIDLANKKAVELSTHVAEKCHCDCIKKIHVVSTANKFGRLDLLRSHIVEDLRLQYGLEWRSITNYIMTTFIHWMTSRRPCES